MDSSKRMCLAKSLDSQIANLQNDGVVFDICNEESTKAYLSANTYLFRIKRYASNFNKNHDGKYKNLDFAVLKDLTVIDYELRMALEYLVANAEHDLKVRFNNLLMSNSELDGKRIAKLVDPHDCFVFDEKTGYQNQRDGKPGKTGIKLKYSPYSDAMVRKYFPDPEIWNLWECFNLGDLIDSYMKYLESSHLRDNATKFFGNFRRLRNAVSHSAPLLLDVDRTNMQGHVPQTEFVDGCLCDLFQMDRPPAPIPSTIKKSQLVYDYSSFLCMFLIICNSMPIRRIAAKLMSDLEQRICKNYEQYYQGNSECIHLRNTLACIIRISRAFSAYIKAERDKPHQSGRLHFIPQPFPVK
ncbi:MULTISPECIES: Abi family protein [Bifidobacterium]|uniref:Abi family protein n=1 Tax=Bifidobacterium TaxID=1678 RepID=UPI0018DCC7DE|nr:Abi family protein [Bifidobacterium asteroides]MBI0100217.1 Abi family protein [Bifidobacterium sp. W8114]